MALYHVKATTLPMEFHENATPSAAPSSPTDATDPPSRLLTMPAEVRRKIFTYALTCDDQPVHMHLSPSSARHKSLLRLLLVCRQIYVECLPLFYRHNNLVFGCTSALYAFLSTLSPARRKEIEYLTLEGYGTHYTSTAMAAKAFDLLRTCDRLINFRLDLGKEFIFRADTVFSCWKDTRALIPLTLGQDFEKREWVAGMTSLKKLRGLLHVSIRIQIDAVGSGERGMVEMPAKGRWGPLCQNLRNRWKRPPLWGLDERDEGTKRMARWRQGIDEMLADTMDTSCAPPWYVYESVIAQLNKDLGNESDPDTWI